MGGATVIKVGKLLTSPISIHAPRGGSDNNSNSRICNGWYFNPRSPWGERLVFQQRSRNTRHFNPRSPWGERLLFWLWRLERDRFQSTLPVGGATLLESCLIANVIISIHAPRGGSDLDSVVLIASSRDFNPRSPWGERPFSPGNQSGVTVFQSTLPVGGATAKMHKFPAASLAKVSNFVGQAPGKAVPNRFKSRYSPHRFTKKPCEPPGNSCSPELRTTGSGYPPADRCSCSRNAQPFFHIDSPGSRSGGCPFPDP